MAKCPTPKVGLAITTWKVVWSLASKSTTRGLELMASQEVLGVDRRGDTWLTSLL
jgi:hypothetical protein